ncbi:sigma-70 family RNA polymerase sigma factor [Dermatophilus congolensis]|nr:sigma-70 family RNA polymerase sigma factor [Dermatophilus congolensis]MBO3130038.1 sigma-70 family RNA polymerase sigma factor [Dermatophilus congolensis]MBO3131334.1 sigma-70 family RNA polymerase sigma factor [Dermatophilus congolensis]MBO3134510.1 sigma-70 family RNA polymerase sigma factor [Dermatophilus congolensis]MBO3136747.1 sigma-70 family RNA polymerase sigma factor [Dermatophilus congolensis]MBO3138990.1 sigma-70 family RNA polymerase sigma factor [Dermatophilus congolensis]
MLQSIWSDSGFVTVSDENQLSAASSTESSVDIDELCRVHLPLVHFEVRSIGSRLPSHVYMDDLVSAGMAALAAAARSFDPSLGVPFGRYAVRRIRGALLDELRSADWATRSLRSKVRRRDAVHDELAAKLGRRPEVGEVAQALGVSVSELEKLDADLHSSVVLRLDVITDGAGGDGSGVDALLPSSVATPEATLLARERRAYLRDAVAVLPERLRVVVRGCFFEDRPMRELAEELGVTESRISQMRAEALKLLRDGMNSQLSPEMLESGGRGGAVARRKAAYYAQVAARSNYRERLSLAQGDEDIDNHNAAM